MNIDAENAPDGEQWSLKNFSTVVRYIKWKVCISRYTFERAAGPGNMITINFVSYGFLIFL